MTNIIYVIIYALIILAIYFLAEPKKAYLGNYIATFSLLFSIIYTLLSLNSHHLIPVLSLIITGAIISILISSHITLPNLPQMVAIFNGLGGLSSSLIGLTEITTSNHHHLLILFIIFIGLITFSSSFATFIKLQNINIPISNSLLKIINYFILTALIISTYFAFNFFPQHIYIFTTLSLSFGFFFVLTIGGADMPIIISILNSLSGWCTVLVGFSLNNILLIIVGSIIGSSGLILTHSMTKAMNRKLSSIFTPHQKNKNLNSPHHHIHKATPKDASFLLENAHKVIIIPGFGLASSNAQYEIVNMANILKNKYHVNVKFAIHPIAGRMPGHLNVLLAEANLPAQDVFELKDINQDFKTTDIAFIIGANDITNPLANTDPQSSIYKMPILNAELAKRIIFVKRSLSPGYSGLDNPLFYLDKTLMLLGDAKEITKQIITNLE